MKTSRHLRRALVLSAALLTGCGLLDTQQPDIIEPGGLDTPEGAQARRAGAIRDFGVAKDGDGSQFGTEGLLLLSGDLADEFMHSGFIPSTVEFDQRLVVPNNGSVESIFSALQVARVDAEDAASRLQRFGVDPDNDSGIPEMLNLSGFTYVYFAENFCSGVPYSALVNGDVVPGPQDSTLSTLNRAVARFDSALGWPATAADPDQQYLAQVGKARALLNLGLYDAAEAAVAGVPDDWAYFSEHAESPLTLANGIAVYGISESNGGSISMSDREGGNGLPFRSAADSRVPFVDTGHLGLDQTTPQFDILKYPDLSSDVPVANGVEARLIEAEAALNRADITGMKQILDAIRATEGLDTLDTPANQTEAVDQLFSERGFWLYATGHRLGDLRRLVRQYGRSVNSVFPVGNYLRGGSYGSRVAIPVPISEDQNPLFDRSRCNPDQP